MSTDNTNTDELLDSDQDQERHKGYVEYWNAERGFAAIIDWNDRQRFVAMISELPPDNYGIRYAVPDENVSFTIAPNPKNGKLDRAVKVVPTSRPLYQPVPVDYQEECTVTAWDGNFGFAKRNHIRHHDLVVLKNNFKIRSDSGRLRIGSVIVCGVARPTNPKHANGSFEATNIRIRDAEGATTSLADALVRAGF